MIKPVKCTSIAFTVALHALSRCIVHEHTICNSNGTLLIQLGTAPALLQRSHQKFESDSGKNVMEGIS
jgi:hypothetical protein